MTTPHLHSVKQEKCRQVSSTQPAVDINKKHCLDSSLENSLRLEAAMFELQKEFRSRSKSISQSVGKLGQLLGVKKVA